MNLPALPKDKANHVIYGILIYALSSLILAPIFALITVYIAAIAKEFYDKSRGKKRFSYGDVMATLAGGIIGTLITLSA